MVHNKPIQVVVFTLMGPEMQTKYILRCRNCRLNERDHLNPAMEDHRQDVWYHPDMVKLKVNSFINMQICTHFQYGNVKNGWAHYKKHEATLVKSSNVVFLPKKWSTIMPAFSIMAGSARRAKVRHIMRLTETLLKWVFSKTSLLKIQMLGNNSPKR